AEPAERPFGSASSACSALYVGICSCFSGTLADQGSLWRVKKSAIIRPPRMVFTSLTFIVFYVIVFALYWPLGKVGQNRLIVLSGLVFYGSWDWRFAVLLLCTTGVVFGVGLVLEMEVGERKLRSDTALSM